MTTPDQTALASYRPSIRARIAVFCLVLAVPVIAHLLWQRWTALPPVVRIATGSEGGRYRQVAEALGNALRDRLGLRAEIVESTGSVSNLKLLGERKADFALVQPEAVAAVDHESTPFRSVASVYSEVVQLLVRQDSGIESAFELKGRTVSVGPRESGDSMTAAIVLAHLGLSADVDLDPRYFDYTQIQRGFEDGSLDAALVTVGIEARFLQDLSALTVQGKPLVRVLGVPYAEALTLKQLSMRTHEIPAAAIRAAPFAVPAEPVSTIAVRAQLVTHADVPVQLVEEITRILTDLRFDQDVHLRELVQDGLAFAKGQTVFPLHDGALQFYDPDLKPLLPSDFVEATEGLRSFVVSMLVAGWLMIRWWRKMLDRRQEHRLDRCIQSLLNIERRQMDLDQTDTRDDSSALQLLLDEVTALRQDALRELSAHDLNDDPAAAAFVGMCHALSDKINAKLTRQRLDSRLRQLIEKIETA
jgi:TRAP transporter TAXI family solute receptor